MNPRYPAVAGRAGHRCEYCHAPEVVFNFPFEVEHIVPTAQGGASDDTNLALACRSCNLHKGGHVEGLDEVTGTMARLFHPRTDRWNDHFEIVESGFIRGMTAIGRASASQLNINAETQVRARRLWLSLGLFRV